MLPDGEEEEEEEASHGQQEDWHTRPDNGAIPRDVPGAATGRYAHHQQAAGIQWNQTDRAPRVRREFSDEEKQSAQLDADGTCILCNLGLNGLVQEQDHMLGKRHLLKHRRRLAEADARARAQLAEADARARANEVQQTGTANNAAGMVQTGTGSAEREVSGAAEGTGLQTAEDEQTGHNQPPQGAGTGEAGEAVVLPAPSAGSGSASSWCE